MHAERSPYHPNVNAQRKQQRYILPNANITFPQPVQASSFFFEINYAEILHGAVMPSNTPENFLINVPVEHGYL